MLYERVIVESLHLTYRDSIEFHRLRQSKVNDVDEKKNEMSCFFYFVEETYHVLNRIVNSFSTSNKTEKLAMK